MQHQTTARDGTELCTKQNIVAVINNSNDGDDEDYKDDNNDNDRQQCRAGCTT